MLTPVLRRGHARQFAPGHVGGRDSASAAKSASAVTIPPPREEVRRRSRFRLRGKKCVGGPNRSRFWWRRTDVSSGLGGPPMTVMAVDTRWAGTPLDRPHWLEGGTGFPPGGIADTGLGLDTEILAGARQASLTRRQVDEVVAFAELLAGRALPEPDRAQLSEDLVEAFEDSPVETIGFLRPLAGGVTRLATMGPVERAVRRLQALTTTWTLEQRRML